MGQRPPGLREDSAGFRFRGFSSQLFHLSPNRSEASACPRSHVSQDDVEPIT